MKYIISENRLDKLVAKFLDNMFRNGIYNESAFNYETEERDENILIFYDDDYANDVENEPLFEYITKEYYEELDPDIHNTLIEKWSNESPLIEILRKELVETLTSNFGDDWKPGFKMWFEKRFELPVKSIIG